MKWAKRLSILLLPAAMLIPVSCEQAPERVAPPPPRVSVAHPEIRNLVEYDEYNGWIDSTQTVDVRARVRGHIQKVDFTDGDLVKKDQLLFELDPRPFEADVGRATDQLHIYQAQLVAAQKEEARLKDLLSKGGSSQSNVDKAEADRLSLEAQVEGANHEIDRNKLNLEYASITAPIAGRIGRAMLTEGNLVSAGGSDPVLATIVSIDPVYVYFSVDERAMQRYMRQRASAQSDEARSGDLKNSKLPFQFALETDSGFPNQGVLDFVNNQVDPQTGTVVVRGSVANSQGMFLPGSRVKIRVPLGAAKATTLVPDTAILSDQDKKYVLVVDDKNVVQRRDINTGRLLDDGMRVVLPGDNGAAISPDERIIVLGIQSARINYPVEPVGPTTQPAAAATSQSGQDSSDFRGAS
jgi:RND family efflux transporter MFP subunit